MANLVHERLVQLDMQLNLELGKQALETGDLAAARSHFARSTALGGWKARCVAVAIRVAPGLLRKAYLRRRPPLEGVPDITSAA